MVKVISRAQVQRQAAHTTATHMIMQRAIQLQIGINAIRVHGRTAADTRSLVDRCVSDKMTFKMS